MQFLSEYDRLGFLVSEIYPFLERHGVALARNEAKEQPSPSTDWMKPLRSMSRFPVRQAAWIMAGEDFDQSDDKFILPDKKAEIGRYRMVLLDAIKAGDFPGDNWKFDPDEQEIPHEELREWCARNDLPWPIPPLAPRPATNDEALAEIERLKADKASLMDEMKEGGIPADCDEWPPELDACFSIWRRAKNLWLQKKYRTPKLAVEAAIMEFYPRLKLENKKLFERYSAVCNWDKAPGRK